MGRSVIYEHCLPGRPPLVHHTEVDESRDTTASCKDRAGAPAKGARSVVLINAEVLFP